MEFSNKLQMLRKKANLTQDDLAEQLSVSRQVISKWESGTSYPDLKKAQTLCTLFRISVNELFHPDKELSGEPHDARFNEQVLPEKIKRLRTARGFSQESFAEALNVSRQSVYKWENGSITPKFDVLICMLDILETDFSELLPACEQNSDANGDSAPVDTPADREDEQLPESNDTPSPKSSKQKKHAPWWLISLSTLLLAVLTVAGILILPVLCADPITKTFDDLFFDHSSMAGVTDRWEKKGAEILLGKEDPIRLTVKTTGTTVVIGGFSQGEVALPRQNIKSSMESSVLHPESGSKMALTESEYDDLLLLLQTLIEQKDPDVSQEESLRKTFSVIEEKCTELAQPTVSYSFAEGSLALSKEITCKIDKKTALFMLDAISNEVRKNPYLNKLKGVSPITGENISLSQWIWEYRNELDQSLEKLDMTLMITVKGQRIQRLSIDSTATYNDVRVEVSSLLLECSYEKNASACKLTHTSQTMISGQNYTSTTVYSYQKKITGSNVKMTLDVECTDTISLGDYVESNNTVEMYRLSYNRANGEFSAKQLSDAPEYDSEVSGIWKLDEKNGALTFSIGKITLEGESLFEGDALACSIRALGKSNASEPTPLFEMTADQMRALYFELPIKKTEQWIEEITGITPAIVYSLDGQPVTERILEETAKYEEIFLAYQKNTSMLPPLSKIYVYDETLDVFFLLKYTDRQLCVTNYAYEMSSDLRKDYHSAKLDSSGLAVHDFEVVKTIKAPTCIKSGELHYRCSECALEKQSEAAALGHDHVTNKTSAVTDDGVTREIHISACQRCGAPNMMNIIGYATFYFSQDSNGAYRFADYFFQGEPSDAKLFSIPENLLEGITLTGTSVKLTDRFTLVRIPSGFETIKKGSFSDFTLIQTLILPSTLTEIESDAFSGASGLRTIYFCGTEEQWKQVKLNVYANLWKNVTVIFAPDGVSAETAAGSYTH